MTPGETFLVIDQYIVSNRMPETGVDPSRPGSKLSPEWRKKLIAGIEEDRREEARSRGREVA